MARPFHIEWQEDEHTLYELYKQETDPHNRTRFHALWLLRQGRPLSQVAELVGIHYRTLQAWVAWYRHGGVAEVRSHRHGGHGGQLRRLTSAQEADLKAKAAAGDIRTIQDGVAWVKATYDVDYSYWGMRWVFDRLALRKKVPRPKSPQASAEQQAIWKKGA